MSGTHEKAPVEEQELYSSWALLIQITLLIGSLFTSYYLQVKQIRAIHETVVSIFSGMIVGLIIRLSPGTLIQKKVTFHYSYFFNLLLPPIILNSGYEMKKEKFFRNFGTILTFAFAGTFISALVIGILVAFIALIGIDSLSLSFLDSMIFGSVLSATDPVTVLTIFQTLKVDPQLYSIIFGESILNDAVAIVLYETLKQYRGETFQFSNIVHGIVSLLFCGITLKHYAYDNMSLRTQRTTKYMFHVLAQLSENFIFIYLGMTLFTQTDLEYKPFFIFFTAIIICFSRYLSVFPLSNLLNSISKYRRGSETIPHNHSVMLFWSGLRGAVAFALAAGLEGNNKHAMKTTILVLVVLSVIVFGGTTSRMLEILNIQMGSNSQGSVVSADSGNFIGDGAPLTSGRLSTKESDRTHWFISFDDSFLKPIFTRTNGILPQERWQYDTTRGDEEGLIGLMDSPKIESSNHENDGNYISPNSNKEKTESRIPQGIFTIDDDDDDIEMEDSFGLNDLSNSNKDNTQQ
ncbi:14514_t:CDS:10 [Entrophospora sp. SA101]|nr:14514_t:CDS:10 [Entrophospora sp. SA101]